MPYLYTHVILLLYSVLDFTDLLELHALVFSQPCWFNEAQIAVRANIVLLTEVSFDVVLQLVMLGELLFTHVTLPSLDSLVDQFMVAPGTGPSESHSTRKPAFVVFLPCVFGHVDPQVLFSAAPLSTN